MRSAFLFLREVPAIITYHIYIVFHLASRSEVLDVILFVIFYHLIGAPGDLSVILACRCGDFHRLSGLCLLSQLLLFFLLGGYGGLPAGGDDLRLKSGKYQMRVARRTHLGRTCHHLFVPGVFKGPGLHLPRGTFGVPWHHPSLHYLYC